MSRPGCAGILDDASDPAVEESWTISLSANQRWFTFAFNGQTLRAASYKAARRSLFLNSSSITALFDRGVVQMMHASPLGDFFGSYDHLGRVYSLGGGCAIDIVMSAVNASEVRACGKGASSSC